MTNATMTEHQDNQTAETTVPGDESNADNSNGAPTVETTGEQQNDAQNGNESRKGNREARYRVERNEARHERDALQQRIDSLLTREAERVASKHLAEPADLFTLTGKSVRDFVGEDGELDAELVTATANEILGTRPGLKPADSATDRSQGLGGGAQSTGPTWSDVIRK
ncbi:MAG: hypothetical protein KAH46_13785 [Mycobacterium sp.]|nr:hypothetical protein [Mycobacterium sp.]